MRRQRRQQRVFSLLLLCFIFFLVLGIRMGYLQLIQGPGWAEEAVKQRSHDLLLDHNRGDIMDRHGISLLGGKEEKVLAVFPSFLQKKKEEIAEIVTRHLPGGVTSGSPYIALRDLQPEEEVVLKDLLASGLVIAKSQRRYGDEALATHVVGHTGPSDGQGKVGIELAFDEELRGDSPTILAAVVDGKNNLVPGLGFRLRGVEAHLAPHDVVLTIDSNIQRKMEEVLDERGVVGAAIVMDPYSGDILAMASRPNYLQSQLSGYLDGGEETLAYLSAQPFINRSIISFPPGSVFKLVTAAAALETGKVRLSSVFDCQGYLQVGERRFRCHGGIAHGSLSLEEAFAYSCNSVFIQLAFNLGRENLYQYALKLGLGEATALPLGTPEQGGESGGFIPTPEEIPFLGDLALTAIGQGKVEATPLQIARLTAIVANGGYLVEPRLVQKLQTEEGAVVEEFSPGARERVLSAAVANKLRYMMLGVVEYGTGKEARIPGLVLGGKTGTAETGKVEKGEPLVHSWFTGSIPLERTRAVLTVFLEKPLEENAAKVFQEIAAVIYPFL